MFHLLRACKVSDGARVETCWHVPIKAPRTLVRHTRQRAVNLEYLVGLSNADIVVQESVFGFILNKWCVPWRVSFSCCKSDIQIWSRARLWVLSHLPFFDFFPAEKRSWLLSCLLQGKCCSAQCDSLRYCRNVAKKSSRRFFASSANGFWSGMTEPGTPHGTKILHFCISNFALINLSNKITIGSIAEVHLLMKKKFHSFFWRALVPNTLKKVPPGALVGLTPSNKTPIPPNWNMRKKSRTQLSR